jgi:hypothetical protein
MVVREKSRLGLRSAGFAVNPGLWDATRRAGALAVAAEGGDISPSAGGGSAGRGAAAAGPR